MDRCISSLIPSQKSPMDETATKPSHKQSYHEIWQHMASHRTQRSHRLPLPSILAHETAFSHPTPPRIGVKATSFRCMIRPTIYRERLDNDSPTQARYRNMEEDGASRWKVGKLEVSWERSQFERQTLGGCRGTDKRAKVSRSIRQQSIKQQDS